MEAAEGQDEGELGRGSRVERRAREAAGESQVVESRALVGAVAVEESGGGGEGIALSAEGGVLGLASQADGVRADHAFVVDDDAAGGTGGDALAGEEDEVGRAGGALVGTRPEALVTHGVALLAARAVEVEVALLAFDAVFDGGPFALRAVGAAASACSVVQQRAPRAAPAALVGLRAFAFGTARVTGSAGIPLCFVEAKSAVIARVVARPRAASAGLVAELTGGGVGLVAIGSAGRADRVGGILAGATAGVARETGRRREEEAIRASGAGGGSRGALGTGFGALSAREGGRVEEEGSGALRAVRGGRARAAEARIVTGETLLAIGVLPVVAGETLRSKGGGVTGRAVARGSVEEVGDAGRAGGCGGAGEAGRHAGDAVAEGVLVGATLTGEHAVVRRATAGEALLAALQALRVGVVEAGGAVGASGGSSRAGSALGGARLTGGSIQPGGGRARGHAGVASSQREQRVAGSAGGGAGALGTWRAARVAVVFEEEGAGRARLDAASRGSVEQIVSSSARDASRGCSAASEAIGVAGRADAGVIPGSLRALFDALACEELGGLRGGKAGSAGVGRGAEQTRGLARATSLGVEVGVSAGWAFGEALPIMEKSGGAHAGETEGVTRAGIAGSGAGETGVLWGGVL